MHCYQHDVHDINVAIAVEVGEEIAERRHQHDRPIGATRNGLRFIGSPSFLTFGRTYARLMFDKEANSLWLSFDQSYREAYEVVYAIGGLLRLSGSQ